MITNKRKRIELDIETEMMKTKNKEIWKQKNRKMYEDREDQMQDYYQRKSEESKWEKIINE